MIGFNECWLESRSAHFPAEDFNSSNLVKRNHSRPQKGPTENKSRPGLRFCPAFYWH